MDKKGSIIGGVILITVGGLLLLSQLFPGMAGTIGGLWPLIVVGVGGLFLLSAFAGNADLSVPGCFLVGLGAILTYQNSTGNWASWAFMWTLFPGFVGLGLVLSSVLDKTRSEARSDGWRLVGISAALFVLFGAFFSGWGGMGRYWPLLLIGAGIWLVFKNRAGRTAVDNPEKSEKE